MPLSPALPHADYPGTIFQLTSPNMGSLKPGESPNAHKVRLRNQIKMIQRALSRLGYELDIDGEYGPQTASCIAAWKYLIGAPMSHPNALASTGWNLLVNAAAVPESYRKVSIKRADRQVVANYKGLSGHFRSPASKLGWRYINKNGVHVVSHPPRKGGRIVPNPIPKPVVVKTASVKAMDLMIKHAKARVIENPAGSNKVPALKHLAETVKWHNPVTGKDVVGIPSWYHAMGWPWCAYEVALTGLASGSKFWAWGFAGKFNGLYCPAILEAAASGKYNARLVSRAASRPGDPCLFQWDSGAVDHIGRVVDPKIGTSSVATVEGNAGPQNADSDSGQGVFRRTRNASLITHYIRET